MGILVLLITMLAYGFIVTLIVGSFTALLQLFGYEHLYKPPILMSLFQTLHIPENEFYVAIAWTLLIFLCFIVLFQLPPVQGLFLKFQNISKPKDDIEKYLQALWGEVCERANVDPHKYRLYIQHENNLNAFALGHDRVVVLVGALSVLEPEEVKALLAHELSHLVHRDTTYGMTHYALSLAYSWVMNIFNISIILLTWIYNILRFIPVVGWIAFVFILISLWFRVVIFIFHFIVDLFLLLLIPLGVRSQEFRADRFAYELGYGDSMISLLEKIIYYYGDSTGFKNQLTNDHPSSHKRIERIKKLFEKGAPLKIKSTPQY